MKHLCVVSLLGVLACLIPAALAVEADPIASGSWTMILLPDTQHYSTSYPNIFEAQTQWIADHRESHNIQMVLHQGDLTNKNDAIEFTRAKAAMAILETAGVPYSVAPGNHDYGSGGNTSSRDSLFNDTAYFGPGSAYAAQSHFAAGSGGFFETGKTDNSYCTFTAGDQDWLVFSTEFGPRDQVVAWMDSIAAAHPTHNLILNTHAYLYRDCLRLDWANYAAIQDHNPHSTGVAGLPGGVNDGQELWDKLVKKHENWNFTFNGHVQYNGTGWLSSKGDNNNVVHQILANYQMRPEGGEGYLRILEFMDDGDTVNISSYSPHLGSYLGGFDQNIELSMSSLPPAIRGVSATNLDVPLSATSNATSVWSVVGSGPSDVATITPPNVADLSLAFNEIHASRGQGVLMASVRQNGRNGFHGTVEVAQVNSFSGYRSDVLQITTSRAYLGGEYNMNVAAAMFPFADGWIGGHVSGGAALMEHYGVSADSISAIGIGRYRLSIDGIDSRSDGMLLVVGGEKGYNHFSSATLNDGSGWEIAGRNNTATAFGTLNSSRWSFVYIDYDAPGLTGGRVAPEGELINAKGDFVLTRPSTGVYRITIDGYTPDDGILLLSASGRETENGITRPTDNILSYEADEGSFLIHVRDRNGTTSPLEDGEFVFAFLAFDVNLRPALPGDVNYDGRIDAKDAAILAKNWGRAVATWAMGDLDLDGVVGPKDAAILAANWGEAIPSGESVTVPEPGAGALLSAALAVLAWTRRRGVRPHRWLLLATTLPRSSATADGTWVFRLPSQFGFRRTEYGRRWPDKKSVC